MSGITVRNPVGINRVGAQPIAPRLPSLDGVTLGVDSARDRPRRLPPLPPPECPLTADATPPAWNGNLLTVSCSCGVVFERWITTWDAELDLLRAAGLN